MPSYYGSSSALLYPNQSPLTCSPLNSHCGQLTQGLLIAQVLSLAKDLRKKEGTVRSLSVGIPLIPFSGNSAYPSPIAGCLIAIQQSINEGLAHTLERSTSVPKI